MWKLYHFLFLSTFVYSVHLLGDKHFEDAKLGTLELVKKYGYNGELHYVTTEDNYILELHRISGGPKSAPQKGKKVCLLTHGLTGQSSEWVASGPNQALAYLLADEGFDVFMANTRGTDYGLNHTTLKPFGSKSDQKQFWSFSFEEFGVYDTTATIDYILALTEQKKLQYIGHSQGGTVYFIMLSERPEYNDKIEMAHQLAPGVPMPNVLVGHDIAYLQSLLFQKLFEATGIYHIAPSKSINQICRDVSIAKYFCANFLKQIMGRPTDQLNMTLVPMIFGHFANNLGTHLIAHSIQLSSGEFRRFDFGKIKNLEHYGDAEPPKYNLKNAKSPVAVYYAASDPQVPPQNARKLIKELPNVALDYLVPHKAFNHGDFAYGKDARRLVYYQILKTMKSATNE